MAGGVDVGVEGAGELIGGEDVQAAVADEGRSGGDGVQRPLQAAVGCPLPGAAASASGECVRAVGGLREVEQVGAFGFVELEGPGHGFEDGGGDTGEVAAFELGVVLHAHVGEGSDLGSGAGRARAVGCRTVAPPAPA